MKRSPSRPLLLGGLLALIALACCASLVVGRVWVPVDAWISSDPRAVIIAQLRVPRTLLGVLVGGALGLSGAAMQGYTRNALADPGVLGVSSMAALGAVASLFFGLQGGASWALAACAMIGAAVGVGALLGLAGGAGATAFLLAGVILNTVAGAGVALALSLAPSPFASGEILDWLMGSLADRSLADVRLAAPFIALGGGLLLASSRALDGLTLGETGARSLGIDLNRTRLMLALGVGLCTGAAVAVSGVIGFVGLVVPHLLRPLVGGRPGALLVPSALAGAALLVVADVLVRLVPAAAELKLGIATALVGGPFFLALLMAERRRLT